MADCAGQMRGRESGAGCRTHAQDVCSERVSCFARLQQLFLEPDADIDLCELVSVDPSQACWDGVLCASVE